METAELAGIAGETPAPREKEWEFEGVASSSRLDRQREKMTAAALETAAGAGEVELVLAHRGSDNVVGVVRERWIEDGKLRVRGTLREGDAAAEELQQRMARGEKLGLSLGGKVTGAHWGYDRETEGPVRHLDGVKVEHVAVCRAETAVNPDAWVGLRRRRRPTPPRCARHPSQRGRGKGKRHRQGLRRMMVRWLRRGLEAVRRVRTRRRTEGAALAERLRAVEQRLDELEAAVEVARSEEMSDGAAGDVSLREAEGSGSVISPAEDGCASETDASTRNDMCEETLEKARGSAEGVSLVAEGEGTTADGAQAEVRRGMPQGIPGQQARRTAARLWEGVL